MPQIHRDGTHSVGLVSLSNMDNQPAETLEKYNTENVGVSQGDVRLLPVPVLVTTRTLIE
jgi:hypothetical protein